MNQLEKAYYNMFVLQARYGAKLKSLKEEEEIIKNANNAMKNVEDLLQKTNYVAGNQLSIADIHIMFNIIISVECVPQIEIPG